MLDVLFTAMRCVVNQVLFVLEHNEIINLEAMVEFEDDDIDNVVINLCWPPGIFYAEVSIWLFE